MTNGFADSKTYLTTRMDNLKSFRSHDSPHPSCLITSLNICSDVSSYELLIIPLLRYLRIISDTFYVFSSKVFERNSFARFRQSVISLQIIFLRAAFKLITKPYEISRMSHNIKQICISHI